MNQSWIIPSAVFILAKVLQTKISLSSKFLRNLGSMPKTFTHVVSTSRKHATGFLVTSFGECCKNRVLTTTFYWPSSHCIPAQKFVSASGKLNHDRSPLVLDSDKGACSHCFSLHGLHQRWPNYGPWAASGLPTSLIGPAKYLAKFFQVPRFRQSTAVQQHQLLPVT